MSANALPDVATYTVSRAAPAPCTNSAPTVASTLVICEVHLDARELAAAAGPAHSRRRWHECKGEAKLSAPRSSSILCRAGGGGKAARRCAGIDFELLARSFFAHRYITSSKGTHERIAVHRPGWTAAEGRHPSVGQQERCAADHLRRAAHRASGHARERAPHPRRRDARRARAVHGRRAAMDGAEHAFH